MHGSEEKKFNLGFAILLPAITTLLLIVLKLAGYPGLSWWLVLAPIWLVWLGLSVILLLLAIRTRWYNSGIGIRPTLSLGRKRQSPPTNNPHIFKS